MYFQYQMPGYTQIVRYYKGHKFYIIGRRDQWDVLHLFQNKVIGRGENYKGVDSAKRAVRRIISTLK